MANNIVVEKRDRRSNRGRVIALSRTIYRIKNKDVYYVESETKDGMFYFVKYDTENNFEWCSCNDNSNRKVKCKHIFAVFFGIKGNVIIDTDKLPSNAKKYYNCNVDGLGYTKESYDF